MRTQAMQAENQQLTPVRRANIRLLTDGAGASARLAELMGVTAGPISAVRAESEKSIGSGFCRKIESAIGLPDGWLDTPKDTSDVPDEISVKLSRSARGSAQTRQAFIGDPDLPAPPKGRVKKLRFVASISDEEIVRQVREAMTQGSWFAVVCDSGPIANSKPRAPNLGM